MTFNHPIDRRGGGGASPPHQGAPQYGQPQPQLPPGYLQKGYFDTKGNLLPEIMLDWPRQIAQALANARPELGKAQLRGRFFGEVRRQENKLDAIKDFDAVRPEVLRLAAFAEDAAKKNKVPQLFKQFIEANIKWATRGEKEFRGFVSHFECVVGFFPEK